MASTVQPQLAAGGGEYEDQTGITWTDPNYPHALTRFTALHYFELSPFFDPACNNTLARQQGRDPAIIGALEFVSPAGGLEYVVELEQPPHLFVIRKQLRRGVDTSVPGATTLLALYYILDKVVYQAPSLHAALSSRIRRCVWSLNQGFSRLQADLDPLVRIAREAPPQQQLAQADAGPLPGPDGAPGSVSMVETVPLTTDMAAEAAAAGAAEGAGAVADAQPVALPKRIPPDEAAYWKRTDNIILTVLSGYKIPELPDVYYKQAAAQQQNQPPVPQDQQQQQQQQQQAVGPAAGGGPQPSPGVDQVAGAGAAAGQQAQGSSRDAAGDDGSGKPRQAAKRQRTRG